jgi:ankyrin repeat protein
LHSTAQFVGGIFFPLVWLPRQISDTPTISNGSTSLMVAAERGYLSTVETLLHYGADIQARSKRGWTALMVAAAGGHTEIIQLFLERGASTKPVTKNGWTALKVALQLDRHEVVQQLKLAGAKE